MRVLLTGGGTAGHVNPALAIAQIIKNNYPSAEIAFVGREQGIEKTLVEKAGYKLYHIDIQGIARSLSPSNIKTAYLVLTSPKKAKKIIEEFSPDLVIGTGGYVCWPTIKAAAAMGIPTMLHESNAIPGVAVKQLQKKVDVIMTNFESTSKYIKTKSRVVRVGNPLSCEFGKYDKAQARKKLGIPEDTETLILSFGGSLGAKALNTACLELMRDYCAHREKVIHYHAKGRIESEYTYRLFSEYGLADKKNIIMSDYIYNMPELMAAADIVICRAGAMTLSEIALMRKAAIIIPSPNVTDNHQYKNAKVLSDAGAATLIEESELTEGRLAREIAYLAENVAQREKMEASIARFAEKNAGKLILREIQQLTEGKKRR